MTWCEKLDRIVEIVLGCRHVGLHMRGVELSGNADSHNPQSTPKGVAWVFYGAVSVQSPVTGRVLATCDSVFKVWSM